MEESTEAHMETDVSSTTEDVPETQEVTGSNGDVEMVIVVEKISEEDMDSEELTEKEPLEAKNTNEEPKPSEESPLIDTEPQTSPTKSPTKEIESVPSPSKPELVQQIVNKDLELDREIELSAHTEQSEDADSSVKEPLQVENDDTPKLSQDSPKEIQKISVEIESSPKKEVLNPVQISPTKEVQLSDSTRSTPTKDSVLVEKFVINGKIQSSEASNDSSCKNITTITPIDITIEREASNDSQLETNSIETNISEGSDRDHNKGISRELKSLIKSAKESKIISECTQLTSKTRKSRSALDTSSTSLNTSMDAEKIHGVRRNSNNSQKSSCSEKSEKVIVKRSMRSQNPEFVSKVKQFLNSVTGKGHKDSDDEDDVVEEKVSKFKKDDHDTSFTSPSKMRKAEPQVLERPGKLRSDPYCWRCHWAVEQGGEKAHPMLCTVCPRTFHYKCLSTSERNKINTEKSWVCPECMIVLQAESSETRSQAMKKISLGMLCDLLKHALERMMDVNGVEPFLQPVDRAAFPDYDKYVVHPMDLSLMKNNINDGLYGSTEAFLADAQWILHNSIIFNTPQSKLTAAARALVRACRGEAGEIEACAECYAAAHSRRDTWFTQVCTTPHILLWAKLKGFPYWPAKGMSVSSAGHVDVRFFGAHDRAWVPARDCFLYCEKDPNNFRTKRADIIESMHEAEDHIRNISNRFGKFIYPPFKTPFDPTKINEQLKMMIPSFDGEVRSSTKHKANASPGDKQKKSRSNSKSSKGSYNDGEMSENEDTHEGDHSTTLSLRKMADGAEIAREEEEATNEKAETTIEVDTSNKSAEPAGTNGTPTQSSKTSESSRKRRRSELVEAVITIMDSGLESKRKKNENKLDRGKKKSQDREPNSSKEIDKPETPDKSKRKLSEEKNDESASKDNEPSSTRPDPEKEKNQRVTPIRIALVQKDKGHNLRTSTAKEAMAKIITPTKDKDNDKDNEKTTPLRPKPSRVEKAEKTNEKTPKEDKSTRAEKRRNSRNNRSLTSTPKAEKQRRMSLERKADKTAEASTSKEKTKETAKENKEKDKVKENTKEYKDKSKESDATSKEKDPDSEKSKKDKPVAASSPKPTNSENIISVKDRLQFDDDTTLAVIARESRTVVISSSSQNVMPTISCVRSLSTTAQNTVTTSTKVTSTAKTPDATIEIVLDSSTSTSTDSSTNAKDAASKLQRLRNDVDKPMVGRVGVRAFARMSSIEKSPNKNDDVQVEIKAEPIDVDDADRHMEKMNLMNAFRLRPVNQIHATSNLREVRINKVLVTPLNAKKTGAKAIEVRPRAKKTFPQPKKPEDSQLNSKNSMVYIPIQPPVTQAPVRPTRVVAGPTGAPFNHKPANATSSAANNLVNTVTTPLMQVSAVPSSSSSSLLTGPGGVGPGALGPGALGSGLGTVPAAVHTVPLMTSVNGQWMFSFQPVMSVGAIENSPSPPILNGVGERGNGPTSLVPLVNSHTNAGNTTGTANATAQPPAAKTPGDTSAPGEPPRLQQRPAIVLLNPFDVNTPIGTMPTPSTAGPVTAKLNQNAVKLADFFRTLLEDSIEKLDEPASMVTNLKLQLEQTKWRHQAEIKEIRHNQELTLAEMRALFEKEKSRAVAEARRAAHSELEAAVKAAKAKQWCANCSQEAQFYCCWNTSYCDYPCQRAHWSQHFNVCTQQRQDGSNNSEPPSPPENRLQPQPDNLPKSVPTSAPALTVGGKLAATRHTSHEPHQPHAQKNAIIVSMVEDQSGNQTMKCVGTYKSPAPATLAGHAPPANMSPIILNKQIMNSEESANKKVVSSGGYLIVGGGTNNSAVVSAARRTHTIQYFT